MLDWRCASIAAMRAATIRDGEIAVREHPDPEPQAGELLVRVRAAGLNGADMLQLKGGYPAPPGAPPDIPGLELAGEVVAIGRQVTRFEPGSAPVPSQRSQLMFLRNEISRSTPLAASSSVISRS